MDIKPFGGILYGGRQFGVGFEGTNDIFIIKYISFHDLSITIDRVSKDSGRMLLRIEKFGDSIGISSGGGLNQISKAIPKSEMIDFITAMAIKNRISRDVLTANGATVTRRIFKKVDDTKSGNWYISASYSSPYLTDGIEGVTLRYWDMADMDRYHVEYLRSNSGPLVTTECFLSEDGGLLMPIEQLLGQIANHATLLFDPLFTRPKRYGLSSTSIKLPGLIKGGQQPSVVTSTPLPK